MKRRTFYLLALVISGLGLASARAVAGDWNSTTQFSSPSEQSLRYNQTLNERLMRQGHVPGSSVTRCETADACQIGGTSTNWNGVTVIENGDGTVTVTTTTTDTDQSNAQTSVDTTGAINLN